MNHWKTIRRRNHRPPPRLRKHLRLLLLEARPSQPQGLILLLIIKRNPSEDFDTCKCKQMTTISLQPIKQKMKKMISIHLSLHEQQH
ncbi:hypothetical protein BCR42DRAFT_423418 [Absidia repens]|uniref:Uncharacterized protein n=1 Tax=Absidia repens TaxID=90262 RepID=A0A1X2I625_9FUNG|nr:hypothetical protein BCR42DRAFT_423418 [Absidia repens]